MNEYNLPEAKEKLEPFGISIAPQTDYLGVIYAYEFYSNNNEIMKKADGYDCQSLKPSDFNMIINGTIEDSE